MALVLDRRTEVDEDSGLHVLLVGVSHYPHLPETPPPADAGPPDFGLRSLSSPSITAYRLYEWLLERQDFLPVPLATIRLLLSPSQRELDAEPELNTVGAGSATMQDFAQAVCDWRADARAHPDGMTWLYYGGHGLQRNREEAILTLQDFGDGVGGSLSKTVQLQHVINGMAPTADGPQHSVARRQIYFSDACREAPLALRDYERMSTGTVFDVPLGGEDDRAVPVFYATYGGARAWGRRGTVSNFGEALLHALMVAADRETDARWSVRVYDLHEVIAAYLEEHYGHVEGLTQEVVLGGQNTDNLVLHTLDTPPEVGVDIWVDPAGARDVARLQLVNLVDEAGIQHQWGPPLDAQPLHLTLPAGMYRVQADIVPPTDAFHGATTHDYVRPPHRTWTLDLQSP